MMGESCIDEKAIQVLQELGGASFVAEMIDVFLAFVPKILGEARNSLAEGNLEPVGRLGHTLRSNGRNLGAAKIVELAQSIESACREGRAANLPVLLDQMEQAFFQVKDCLEEIKTKL
jgi:HPt (histidine-containing phosphotransfer) domain-containing protein